MNPSSPQIVGTLMSSICNSQRQVRDGYITVRELAVGGEHTMKRETHKSSIPYHYSLNRTSFHLVTHLLCIPFHLPTLPSLPSSLLPCPSAFEIQSLIYPIVNIERHHPQLRSSHRKPFFLSITRASTTKQNSPTTRTHAISTSATSYPTVMQIKLKAGIYKTTIRFHI